MGLKWNSSIRIDMENKVRGLGAEIIKGKGKTHYGIATCVCYIADAILNQRLTIAPVTSVMQGEYGVSDVSLSVPSIIGVRGKMILPSHGKEFFHLTVSTFLHALVISFLHGMVSTFLHLPVSSFFKAR